MDDPEDGDRPVYSQWTKPLDDKDLRSIKKRANVEPKYNAGDSVYIKATSGQQRRGPYIVSEVLFGNKYNLEDNGQEVESGKNFEQSELEGA